MIGRRWRWRSPGSVVVALALVVACSSGGGGSRRVEPDPIDRALEKGAAFLVGRQEADGAIRSPTYAAFRDGYALTGMAAMVLGFGKDKAAYERAVAFLATMIDDQGAMKDVVYPTYAAALAVLVTNHEPRFATTRDALREVLRARQLRTDGGWGYDPSGSNLSTTLLAVGALTLGGVPVGDPALVLAKRFVERCQNRVAPCAAACPTDGGFFFSPSVPDGNKAGSVAWAGKTMYASYGSMTADGVRALVRLGVPLDDPRVKEGADWLERNFDAEQNPGAFAGGAEVRRASAYYYWTWTAAHALRAIGTRDLVTDRGTVDWAKALSKALLDRQRPDGSWKNDATEMREDDPVVATAFAMAALTVCRSVISGEYRSHAGWALVP